MAREDSSQCGSEHFMPAFVCLIRHVSPYLQDAGRCMQNGATILESHSLRRGESGKTSVPEKLRTVMLGKTISH